MNESRETAPNETDDVFFVSDEWITDALFWTPSVLLGLPLNIVLILLSRQRTTRPLGNFRFAIRSVAAVDLLHCLMRAIVLVYYFVHYFFALQTSLISCTVIANLFTKWMGYYIVFFIPLLSGYRFVLLCMKNGEKYLTTFNLYIVIGVFATLPTVLICGRLVALLSDIEIDNDDICGFKYSDRGCSWCVNFVSFISYCCYVLSLSFSIFLFIHLWRCFHKVGPAGMSARRLSDEIEILACIVIQSVIPILLTFPTNGRQFLRSIGFGQAGSAFAATLYNYNPVFDALLIFAFVKPFRRAVLTMLHTRWQRSSVNGSRFLGQGILFKIRTPVVRQSRPQMDIAPDLPSLHI